MSVKLQVKGNHMYVTMWDKQSRRPRRFYLGRREEMKRWEELFKLAREYWVGKDEVRDYVDYFLDKETNLTKVEYVMLSLSLGVDLWKWSESSRTRSGQQLGR